MTSVIFTEALHRSKIFVLLLSLVHYSFVIGPLKEHDVLNWVLAAEEKKSEKNKDNKEKKEREKKKKVQLDP